MKRTFTLQTALMSVVILWGGDASGEDAPVQREDIGRALEMYRWLIDHEEFSAAGKLAAEIQAMHPDDPQVQLIVENAQLRAAVREANRVLVDDESGPIGFTVPASAPRIMPTAGTEIAPPPEPFSAEVDWRQLIHGNQSPTPPAQPREPEHGSYPLGLIEVPAGLFEASPDWDQGNQRPPSPRIPPWEREHASYPRGQIDVPAGVFDASTDWEQSAFPIPEDRGRESPEARTWTALTRPISAHFNNAPLSEIMHHLSETCGVNILIDEAALEREGVSLDREMTLNVDGIQAKSALNLVLRSLNLGYVIEDEVVKVTCRDGAVASTLITRVYAVPDLVTPIPHRTPGSVPERFAEVTASSRAELECLSELIKSTVDPETWQESGGWGYVAPHEGTLSLVIRQQSAAHEEIGDLLRRLRRLRDVQVSHAMHLLDVPVNELHALGLSETQHVRVLKPDERPDFERTVFSKGSVFGVQALPRVTLFNRRTGTVTDSERTLLINSIASPDNRTIRLNVAAPESLEPGDVMAAVHSTVVPDGAVALILVSRATDLFHDENRAHVLAVTPRIETHEEEEELLQATP